MPFLSELHLHDEPAHWRAAGFVAFEAPASGGVCCDVGSVRLRFVGGSAPAARGLTGWAFEDLPGPVDVDGLPAVAAPLAAAPAEHPLGVVGIDHVVVMTPHLARTIAAMERLGFPLRRVRDTAAGGRAVQQAFFRMGEVICEVVGPAGEPAASDDAMGDGPARFWGITFTVADLDAAVDLLGPERVSVPKAAVQPGRRIASLRREAGLGLPVALITP